MRYITFYAFRLITVLTVISILTLPDNQNPHALTNIFLGIFATFFWASSDIVNKP